jgi:hypothetical protein
MKQLLFLSLFFTDFLMAQTGTIKVKKNTDSLSLLQEFTFQLFDTCVGQNLDSAIKWISKYGFTEGELINQSYMNSCGDPLSIQKTKTKLFCRYFHNDSIDLILTYTKKKKVYVMLIELISADHKFAERLLAGSLAKGYQLTDKKDRWRKFSEKGTRLAMYAFDKGVWTFNLTERALVKK